MSLRGFRESVMDLSELYAAHARDVHRFALFLSGDPALAEDIVSETFIRVWHARTRLELSTVRAYLLAIARNLFLQDRRRTRHTAALDDQVPDHQPGPDQQASAKRELRAVLTALQRLPEIDRAAVLMRADDGLSYDEIAGALDISVAAAKVKVHRARLKLAQARLGPAGSPGKETQR